MIFFRQFSSTFVFAAALFCATVALAQNDKNPEYVRGQALAGVCAGCHGVDGNSAVATQPNLAGTSAQYIARQLAHFKSGQRDNAIMKGFATNLSDDEMKSLGVYFAAQKARTVGAQDVKLAKTAEKLYRAGDATRGIAACAGCHSPTGAGIPAQYPRIGGQHSEYVVTQLTAYKAGTRGGATKADNNASGKIMMGIAAKLTDAEIKALAQYTAGLKSN
jgi:cytochrome c553